MRHLVPLLPVVFVACLPDGDSKDDDLYFIEEPREDSGVTDLPGGPPDIAVSETTLEFGEVAVGGEATLSFTIANEGEGELALQSATLADTDGPFLVTRLEPSTLEPGASTTVAVTYSPSGPGEHTNLLFIQSDDPDEPSVEVVVSGTATGAWLTVSPEAFDFGTLYVGCDASRTLSLSNTGTGDLLITAISGTSASDELLLDTLEDYNGELPWSLSPGELREVSVAYTPADESADSLTVSIEGSHAATSTTVTFVGNGELFGQQNDVFEVQTPDAVDILFAVDRSGGMYDRMDDLQSHMVDLVASLDAMGTDYHLAATVEDSGCINGPDLFIDNTTASADIEGVISTMINYGGSYGSNTERAFTLFEQTLASSGRGDCNDGFLRDDAGLALVGVSDEAEQSVNSYTYYVSLFQSLKEDPDAVVFFGIGGDYPSGCDDANAYTGLYEATVATGGTLHSICTSDWAATMSSLGTELGGVGGVGAAGSFPLSQYPVPSSLEVEIDGIVVSTGWNYNPSKNSVDLDTPPASGTTVSVTYVLYGDCDE